jgi:hypothetical protein
MAGRYSTEYRPLLLTGEVMTFSVTKASSISKEHRRKIASYIPTTHRMDLNEVRKKGEARGTRGGCL